MGRRCPEALGAFGQAGCEAVPGAVELRWSGRAVRPARSVGHEAAAVPRMVAFLPLPAGSLP